MIKSTCAGCFFLSGSRGLAGIRKVLDRLQDLSAGNLPDQLAVDNDWSTAVFMIEHGTCHVDDLIVRMVYFDMMGHHVRDSASIFFAIFVDALDNGAQAIEFREHTNQIVIFIDNTEP